MNLFKHFIIIKFDYPEGSKIFYTKLQQLRWIMLETLRHQTNTEFVMVFNSTSPMPHEGFGELIISPVWKDKVRKAAEDYEYIITTRLDGDDFVTPDFIEKIQANFEPEHNLVLEPNGWIFETRVNKVVKNYRFGKFVMNAFSLIEKTDEIKTCYYMPHSHIKRHHKVKWIEDKIHIRCINRQSLRAAYLDPKKIVKNFPNLRNEITEIDDRYTNILENIIKFNNRILAIEVENEKKD